MKFSLGNYLKISVIVLTGLINLAAQTNDSVNVFYTPTWSVAWESPGKAYLNSKGDISFPRDDVVLAKFEVFNYWFAPHPHNNLFHETLLESESKVEYFRVELKLSKRKNRKSFVKGIAIGAGVILGAAITIKVLN